MCTFSSVIIVVQTLNKIICKQILLYFSNIFFTNVLVPSLAVNYTILSCASQHNLTYPNDAIKHTSSLIICLFAVLFSNLSHIFDSYLKQNVFETGAFHGPQQVHKCMTTPKHHTNVFHATFLCGINDDFKHKGWSNVTIAGKLCFTANKVVCLQNARFVPRVHTDNRQELLSTIFNAN